VTDQPSNPRATIPIIRDTELRLAKMRRQLERVARGLHLAHDEARVCADVCRRAGSRELAHVLDRAVCGRIFSELELLIDVLQKLGGTIDLSEFDAPQGDLSHGGSEQQSPDRSRSHFADPLSSVAGA
jgi:hypothetical protein